MRHPDFDYMVVMEQRRDQLAEAEQSRLVKQALDAQHEERGEPAVSLVGRAALGLVLLLGRGMYWFGERIQILGCRLQYRYAMTEMQGEPAPCK